MITLTTSEREKLLKDIQDLYVNGPLSFQEIINIVDDDTLINLKTGIKVKIKEKFKL